MRRKISLKLASIWLAVAVPLVIILSLSYWDRYQGRLDLVTQERVGYARLSALAFEALIEDTQRTMAGLGPMFSRDSDERPQMSALLAKTLADYPAAHLLLADPAGRVVESTDRRMLGRDLSGTVAFERAARTTSGNAIEPSRVHLDARRGFYVAQRVYSAEGRFVGVMMMCIDIQELHDEYPIDVPTGGVTIIDSAGQVVYESETPRAALLGDDWGVKYEQVGSALRGRRVADHDFPSAGSNERVAGFVPIAPFGWVAGSSIDEAEAMGGYWRSLRNSFLLALGFATAGLGVSIYASARIKRALERLANDADIIAAGDFGQPVRVDRQDEIGAVARSLERARQALDRYAEQNAVLFARQQEVSNLNAALASLDATLHSSLAFTDVLSQILQRATAALGCDASGVNLLQDGRWLRTALWGLGEEFENESLTDEQNPIAALVRDTGEPVIIQDAATDPRMPAWFAERYAIRSNMAFPLIARGEVFGAIFFLHTSDAAGFSDAQVDFGIKLAGALSLAYENARLYQGERDVAEKLQSALLALPDRLVDVEYAVRYRSASDTAKVGGDFCDLFDVRPDRVGVTIGDISGHGIDAAVLTSLVKTAVRVGAMDPDPSPAHVLARANQVLYSGSPPESFATVMFGVLDTGSGHFIYSNGGHTRGVVVSGSRARMLEANSPLVGAFPNARFCQSELVLGEDETLFLYTDGLIEGRVAGTGQLFGEQRLTEALRRLHASSVDQMADSVFEHVQEVVGGRLLDDVAILVVRRPRTTRPD